MDSRLFANLAISAVAAADAAATDVGWAGCCAAMAAEAAAAVGATGEVAVDMVIMASAAYCLEHTCAAALSSRACAAATSACSALPREVAVLQK